LSVFDIGNQDAKRNRTRGVLLGLLQELRELVELSGHGQ